MGDLDQRRDHLDHLSNVIIGAALEVHRELGPGMLESAYEACLAFELVNRGLAFEKQKPLPLIYKEKRLACGYRLDLLVDNAIVVEVKAIERLDRVHTVQLLHYLKQMKLNLGLLLNFNVRLLRDGIVRVVNDFPE
jgi:GxxExxY protein